MAKHWTLKSLLFYVNTFFFITLMCFAITKLSFSQSLKPIDKKKDSQFDAIVKAINCHADFLITTRLGSESYIIIGLKDSLSIINYGTSLDNKISKVYLISNKDKDDTAFINTVYTLVNEIKKDHEYILYSNSKLTNSSFYLTFCLKNKIQILDYLKVTKAQSKNINFLLDRLNDYLIMPYNKPNDRIETLKISKWQELIYFLRRSASTITRKE